MKQYSPPRTVVIVRTPPWATVVVVAAAEAMTLRPPVDFGMVEAVARTAVTRRVSFRTIDIHRVGKLLTGKERAGVGDDTGSSIGATTGLVGAVANTIAKVGVTAVACKVSLGALELADGNSLHVVDTGLLFQFVSVELHTRF